MFFTLNLITLPFIGEVNLSGAILIIFFFCLLAVVAFEFVNGFHDTANAVATVIYTKVLKPQYAVIYRIFNKSTVNQIMNRSIKAILVLHE